MSNNSSVLTWLRSGKERRQRDTLPSAAPVATRARSTKTYNDKDKLLSECRKRKLETTDITPVDSQDSTPGTIRALKRRLVSYGQRGFCELSIEQLREACHARNLEMP